MTFLFDWISLLFMGFVFIISSLGILYSDDYMFGDLNIIRFISLAVIFVVSIMFLIAIYIYIYIYISDQPAVWRLALSRHHETNGSSGQTIRLPCLQQVLQERRATQGRCSRSMPARPFSRAYRPTLESPGTSVIDTSWKLRVSRIINIWRYLARLCARSKDGAASVVLWKKGITSACSYCLKNGELGQGCYVSPLSDGVSRSDRMLFVFYDFETAQTIKRSEPEVRELLQAACVDPSRGGGIPEPQDSCHSLDRRILHILWPVGDVSFIRRDCF